MKFRIEIVEKLSRTIDIEADSQDEALQKIRDRYNTEKIILNSEDFLYVEFQMLENVL